MKKLLILMFMTIFLISIINATPQINISYPINGTINFGKLGSSLDLNVSTDLTNTKNIYESYPAGDDATTNNQGNADRWYSQSFTIGNTGVNQSFYVDTVSIKIAKVGAPTGNIDVRIYATSGESPTGSALTYGTIPWASVGGEALYNATIQPIILTAGTKYAVVFNSSATIGDYFSIKYDSTGAYTGGSARTAPDTTSWTNIVSANDDLIFIIWGNISNGTCWYNYNFINTYPPCNFNTTFTLTNQKNLTYYVNDSLGNENSSYVVWDYFVFENNRTFNSTTYETLSETFSINVTANSSLTAVSLNYDGVLYPMTYSGGLWNKTIGMNSTMVGSNSFNFKFTYGGTTFYSSNSTQTVNNLFFTFCNSSYTTKFLNISFKDESSLSTLNASIPSSIFTYYLGDGTVNKTYTFTNNTENHNYTFCSNSPSSLKVVPYIQYKNGTAYPQRVWNPSVQTYTSTITNQILYLLSSADGIYVTFQVVNPSDQLLSGVYVTATRSISGSDVLVGQGTTGGSGTVTFWLNPDYIHTFSFSKTGYTTYTYSDTPTQSSYTITLGGSGIIANDYTHGITYEVYPSVEELFNDTSYTFKFNVTSSYWDLDSFGFNLRLANGTIVGSSSSLIESTPATLAYDVNNQSIIYMDYYWVINGNTTTGSKLWVISNTENTQFSIKYFLTDLNAYINSGIFGLDEFGRYLIVFIILFISVGIMSYKYGLSSPMAVTSMIFAIIFFLDVVVGLIPTINHIEHLLTYVSGLILVVTAVRETIL